MTEPFPHLFQPLTIGEREATVRGLAARAEHAVPCDAVVLATMPASETGLSRELAALGVRHHAISDCVAPRKASLALYEARKLAATL